MAASANPHLLQVYPRDIDWDKADCIVAVLYTAEKHFDGDALTDDFLKKCGIDREEANSITFKLPCIGYGVRTYTNHEQDAFDEQVFKPFPLSEAVPYTDRQVFKACKWIEDVFHAYLSLDSLETKAVLCYSPDLEKVANQLSIPMKRIIAQPGGFFDTSEFFKKNLCFATMNRGMSGRKRLRVGDTEPAGDEPDGKRAHVDQA
jgi:hypothetical protein